MRGIRRGALCLGALGGICWGASSAAAEAHGPADRAPLVEAPVCRTRDVHPSTIDVDRTAATPGTVRVAVPPTAVVTLDRHGHVVAALTNTGCAPRPGDDSFALDHHGTMRPIHRIDPPADGWTGDFSEVGIPQRQSGG